VTPAGRDVQVWSGTRRPVDALASDVCATTLSVDDDVLLAVKERARRENRTAGRVLSDLAGGR
jgi:hypothetical protein